MVIVFEHIPRLVVLTFCPQGGVTTHYNTSVSDEISVFPAWSTGNDQAYRPRRFGCREIKVPSAPIFFNTLYRRAVLLLLQMLFLNILIYR